MTYPEPLPVVDAHQTSGPFPEEASLAPRRVAAALSLRRHARAPRELPPVRSWADAAGYRIIGTVYWKTEMGWSSSALTLVLATIGRVQTLAAGAPVAG